MNHLKKLIQYYSLPILNYIYYKFIYIYILCFRKHAIYLNCFNLDTQRRVYSEYKSFNCLNNLVNKQCTQIY